VSLCPNACVIEREKGMTELQEVALTYLEGYKKYLLDRKVQSFTNVACSYIIMQYYKNDMNWSDYHTHHELERIAEELHQLMD